MNLNSNDFELFNVPQRFAQDLAALDVRWKDLQREAHPDKFSLQGAAAQRVAMQWSVRINEAHQRLKDPVKRAAYLCEINGAAIQAENNTAMPTDFLLQQMELREALEETNTAEKIDEISQKTMQTLRNTLLKTEHLLDVEHNFTEAAQTVRSMLFMQRFAQDIDARYESLT